METAKLLVLQKKLAVSVDLLNYKHLSLNRNIIKSLILVMKVMYQLNDKLRFTCQNVKKLQQQTFIPLDCPPFYASSSMTFLWLIISLFLWKCSTKVLVSSISCAGFAFFPLGSWCQPPKSNSSVWKSYNWENQLSGGGDTNHPDRRAGQPTRQRPNGKQCDA